MEGASFTAEIAIENQSKFKYQIITGYPTIFNYTDEIKNNAENIRKNLKDNGAETIICVLDENSLNDSRWHSGHEIQRENYTFIINELLSNKKLGVIFKPKVANSLRKRLGKYSDLLEKALKTKRCFVYEDVEDLNNSKPKINKTSPAHAALSADLVIHSHLSAGTAAIECALIGKPTLLIDRENAVDSIFNKILPNEKIIFNDWPAVIKAINNNYFTKDKKIEDFGKWDKYLNKFDSFCDNGGATRIGDFLDDLIQGFNNKLNKEEVLENAVKNYSNTWGKKFVIKKN